MLSQTAENIRCDVGWFVNPVKQNIAQGLSCLNGLSYSSVIARPVCRDLDLATPRRSLWSTDGRDAETELPHHHDLLPRWSSLSPGHILKADYSTACNKRKKDRCSDLSENSTTRLSTTKLNVSADMSSESSPPLTPLLDTHPSISRHKIGASEAQCPETVPVVIILQNHRSIISHVFGFKCCFLFRVHQLPVDDESSLEIIRTV